MTRLRSGSATDVGRVRTSNQDVALEDPDLFAVADGMGGHVGGEVAARVAVDSLRAAFERQPTVEGLRRAVAEANRAVWSQGQTESGLRGMGTTLTATALVEESDGRQVIALANVGDSRAYVFSKGQVIQVTADHSLAEEKVRQGQLTEAEAAVHPQRHILTRALGVSSDVDVDLWELHLHEGDRILLCSDGLTNEIGDERIGRILADEEEPRAAAQALVKAAVDHGGSDNVTCVVVDVVGAVAQRGSGAAATGVVAATAGGSGTSGGGVTAGAGARATKSGPDSTNGRSSSEDRATGSDATRTLRVVSGPARPSGTRTAERERATDAPTGNGAAGTPGDVPAGSGPDEVGDGGGTHPEPSGVRAPGALSAARLQASELRRLQPTREDRRYRHRAAGMPRLVTVRVVLFVLLLAGVVAGAYYAVRWYSMADWYVTVDHGNLAVYRGRPGGFLWFKPQLVDESSVTTKDILSYAVPHNREEPSLAAAKRYIHNLHEEYLSTTKLSTGGTTPTGSSSAGTSLTGSSSNGPTSTSTSAFGRPVAAWQ